MGSCSRQVLASWVVPWARVYCFFLFMCILPEQHLVLSGHRHSLKSFTAVHPGHRSCFYHPGCSVSGWAALQHFWEYLQSCSKQWLPLLWTFGKVTHPWALPLLVFVWVPPGDGARGRRHCQGLPCCASAASILSPPPWECCGFLFEQIHTTACPSF